MNHHKLLGALIFLSLACNVSATEYWYPLSLCEGKGVLAMHQIDCQLQVVLCDEQNPSDYTSALASYHSPTHVLLLPNKQAFSFLDNGLLKVKEFCKRSASTLLFEKPFQYIASVGWLTNEICYFHALYKGSYGIFFADRTGIIIHEIWEHGVDFTFPCHDQHSIFYAKNTGSAHSLYQVSYFIKDTVRFSFAHEIISNIEKAPFFITIIDENKGFFINNVPEENTNKELRFKLSRFCKKNSEWTLNWLFDFTILKVFLNGKDIIYELVKPFLPYFFNGFFHYFLFKNGKSHYFIFDEQKSKSLCLKSFNSLQIGLLPTNKGIYFGGSDGIIFKSL